MNPFISRYIGLILLLAAIVGLFIELPEHNASGIIIVSLAVIIFASFFRTDLSPSVIFDDLRSIGFFFVTRFLVAPVLVYLLIVFMSPFYATSFLILMLLPTAVSSPAFTVMFGGNARLSLQLLVVTSFLSILTVPAITYVFIAQKINIDSHKMFMTMVFTIVYPFIFHLPFRGSHFFRKIMNNNGPLITAVGLSVIFIVTTSNNRSIIMDDPAKMALFAAVAVVFYLLSYAMGYYLMFRQELRKRTAYSISSGANNIGLGVALTALFFPGDINVFFIISQLVWIIILMPLRPIYLNMQQKTSIGG